MQNDQKSAIIKKLDELSKRTTRNEPFSNDYKNDEPIVSSHSSFNFINNRYSTSVLPKNQLLESIPPTQAQVENGSSRNSKLVKEVVESMPNDYI